MRKLGMVVLVGVLFLSSIFAAEEQADIFKNGDFEKIKAEEQVELLKNGDFAKIRKDGVIPVYWQYWDSAKAGLAGLSIVPNNSPAGKNAFVVTGRRACMLHAFPAQPGEKLVLTFWAKANLTGNKSEMKCRIAFYDDKKKYVKISHFRRMKEFLIVQKNSCDWQLFQLKFTVPAETTKGGNIAFSTNALSKDESVSFAEFSIRRISAPKPKNVSDTLLPQ